MYYIEEIKIEKAAALLRRCGLLVPSGTDYTAALFTTDGRIVATGSLKKDMIQGVAVDPADQGEDLTAKLMTHLIEKGMQSGFSSLYLFTKPEKRRFLRVWVSAWQPAPLLTRRCWNGEPKESNSSQKTFRQRENKRAVQQLW